MGQILRFTQDDNNKFWLIKRGAGRSPDSVDPLGFSFSFFLNAKEKENEHANNFNIFPKCLIYCPFYDKLGLYNLIAFLNIFDIIGANGKSKDLNLCNYCYY